MKPKVGDYAPFYETYVSKSPDIDIVEMLDASKDEVIRLFEGIKEEQGSFAYQKGKWTIKELLSHLIDSERVFTYRALRISRNDKTAMPGFEQDDYVPESNANNRSLKHIMGEYIAVRSATLMLYDSLSEEMLARKGTASNSPITCNALAYIICGHERHHLGVLKERYLI